MRTVLLLFLVIAANLRAADITLTDGTVFRNATAARHDDKTTEVTFAGGAALVKTEMIIPSNLISSGASTAPTPAASTTAQPPIQAINPAIRPSVDRAAWHASGEIVQVNTDGLIIRLQGLVTHMVTVPHSENTTVNLVPGGLGHTPVYQTENHTWTTDEMVTDKIDLGTVYLICPTTDLVDGQDWTGNVWRVGTYTYSDAASARQTFAKYTARPPEAYAYFTAHPNSIPPPLKPPVPRASTANPATSGAPATSSNQNSAIETPDAGPTINSTSDSLTVPPMNGK